MDDMISRQAAINTEGLDEQIRCEMCRNPMHTDRGCDGNCKYDEKLYERIMQILGERIKPLPYAQPEPCEDDPRADVYYLAEKIGIHQLYALVVALRGEPEPCEDCVSRKAVIRLLHSGYHSKSMIEEVKQLPSVQPKHRTGNWIPVTYRYVIQDGEFPKTTIKWQDATEPDDVEGMKCSECGTIYDFTEARNWCSECGADMRGENDETD